MFRNVDIRELEHEHILRLVADALRLAVDKQFHRRDMDRAEHVNNFVLGIAPRRLSGRLVVVAVIFAHLVIVVLGRIGGIRPVAEDFHARLVRLDGGKRVVVLLGEPHGIDAARHAGVFRSLVASVLVAVRPAEHRASRVVLAEIPRRPVAVEIGVAVGRSAVREREILLRQVPHVPERLLRAAADPEAVVFVVLRSIGVPDATRRLLAAVFRLDHRQEAIQLFHRLVCRDVVAVHHRADVFRLGNLLWRVERATSGEAIAVRIDLFAELAHDAHVFRRNLVVAGFVENDRRRIAEIDHHVAHRLLALPPVAARRLLLRVASGTDVHNAVLVVGPNWRGFRRNMHPADEVRR